MSVLRTNDPLVNITSLLKRRQSPDMEIVSVFENHHVLNMHEKVGFAILLVFHYTIRSHKCVCL